MRLFFAAMLPPDIQRELGKLRQRLRWIPVKGAWSTPENIHITLKFIGEVADDQVMPLVTATTTAIAMAATQPSGSAGPIHLAVHDLVTFPPSGPARVLGVGFSGDTARLIEIQSALEDLCANLGYLREGREYVPHATLARFKDGLRAQHRPRVEQSCASIASLAPFTIEQIQLMQSKLSPAGSQYTTVATFPT